MLKEITRSIERMRNFPNGFGALYVKRIKIRCPINAGSGYYDLFESREKIVMGVHFINQY